MGDMAKVLPRRSKRSILTAEEKAKIKKKEQEKVVAEIKYLESRPFIKYNGKVLYYTDFGDIAMIADSLLEKVKSSSDIMVMGFDLEWPFTFTRGSGKTAVIQISPDLQHSYILHVSKLNNLPKSISELLALPNIRLTGNNIKCDVRKLAKDFVGFDVEKMVANCIDLGGLANIVTVKRRWSLEALVMEFLSLRINKNKKIRNSKWDVVPLSKAQQQYAAIDSYASLLLYQTIKKKIDEQASNVVNTNQDMVKEETDDEKDVSKVNENTEKKTNKTDIGKKETNQEEFIRNGDIDEKETNKKIDKTEINNTEIEEKENKTENSL